MKERFFRMDVKWNERGEMEINTQAKDAPIHDIVAALSQTLYKFNKEWTEKTGFTIKR
jgi:hypothetical protein